MPTDGGARPPAPGEAAGRDLAARKARESRLARLSPAKRALFDRRLEGLREAARPRRAIPRRGESGPAPLSFSQEWWFSIEDAQPAGAASNRPSSLRLSGPLDAAALGRALAEIVRRHEALRTAFPEAGGARVQQVGPAREVPLPFDDLAGLPEGGPMDRALAVAASEVARPFDVAAGPLLRARLLRLAPEDHVLVLVVHHAVFDGWSMAVLARELGALADAFARGLPSPLPEPAVQYADVAAWQRRALDGSRRDELASYWRERLSGAPRAPELPADRPRPAVPSLAGGFARCTIAPALAQSLRRLGRAHGATLYMTCLAAFHALLARLSGRDEVATGCLVSGRAAAETEALIGLFFNAVVLRTDLSGDPAAGELVRRARAAALGAFAHQDMPIHELARLLGARPGPGESPIPLVPVLFQMRNLPPVRARAGALEISEFPHPSGMARFDLTFDLAETADGLACGLAYARDLFDAGTAAGLLADFEAVLATFAADPGVRLSALPVARRRAAAGGPP